MLDMLLGAMLAVAGQTPQMPDNPLNIPMPTPEEMRRCYPPGVTDNTPMNTISRSQMDAALTCIQAMMAGKINLIVPAGIDPLTTIISAQGEGVTLRYNYRVDLDAATIADTQRSALAQATRTYVCGQVPMAQTIRNGGAYRYVWTDRDGRPLHETRVDRCP